MTPQQQELMHQHLLQQQMLQQQVLQQQQVWPPSQQSQLLQGWPSQPQDLQHALHAMQLQGQWPQQEFLQGMSSQAGQQQQPQGVPIPQLQAPPQPWVNEEPVVAPRKYVPPELPNTVPTNHGVERLEPEAVWKHLKTGTCVVVDVRDRDRSSGLIEGAVHVPVVGPVPFPARVPELLWQWREQSLVVFTCQYSCHRAPQCANWYRELSEQTNPGQRVAILVGGFRGWEGSGFPVQRVASGSEDELAADAYAVEHGIRFAMQCASQSAQTCAPQYMPVAYAHG